MSGFAHPWVLFLLVVPAALLIWTWRRRGERIVLPFDHARTSRGGWLKFGIDLFESLPALLLGVAIVILAGPLRLSEPQLKRVLTNIELCVDVSGSMTAPFGDETRYDVSMEAIDEFLSFRKGDAFGLTFFGNSVLHWVPLTSDVSAIRCAPPFMKPQNLPPWLGGTEIGKALIACRETLVSREEGDRMIVLVSDGDSFDLHNGNDMTVAQTLKADNIVVYAIHISETEVPPPIVNITSLTGGEIFAPDDKEGLKSVFKRIDEMQKTRMQKTAAESMDHFGPFSIAGLSLMVVGMISLFGVRYTPW